MEKHRRTIAKAASYRVFATATVFSVAYLFTGQVKSSLGIGLTTATAKTFLYYFWERLWNNINWGLENV